MPRDGLVVGTSNSEVMLGKRETPRVCGKVGAIGMQSTRLEGGPWTGETQAETEVGGLLVRLTDRTNKPHATIIIRKGRPAAFKK